MAIINGTNDPETLIGTDKADIITGGRGDDIAFMGRGGDRFIWNPGDGNDTVDGQAGTDTLAFNGANIAEIFELSANGTDARLTRNVANITMDLTSVERVELRTLGGSDAITIDDLYPTAIRQVAIDLGASIGGGDGAVDTVTFNGSSAGNSIHVAESAGQISITRGQEIVTITNAEAGDGLTINGLDGNDTLDAKFLSASAARLVLDGGAGDDTVTGGHGNDVVFLGSGNDQFTWRTGDGNDVVEGGADADKVDFIGSDAAETIQVVANGTRVLLTDSVGGVTLDVNEVETLDIHTLRGADNVFIGDLTGTGLSRVNVDLAAQIGRTNTDAEADTVTVNGSNTADVVHIANAGTGVLVSGLAAGVFVNHAGAGDQLTINAGIGDDVIDASKAAPGKLHLSLNGGSGADLLIGSDASDTFNGGQGSDTALMGAGDDHFVWNPGDGSDIVEGQAGFDTLDFNGANIAEVIDISANGGRALFTRNVATILMDLNDVEHIAFKALGGADTITIHNLAGTDVRQVDIDLGSNAGTGDGAADTVAAEFTDGKETIKLTQSADGTVSAASAGETITVAHADAGDKLTVEALDGDDTIDASALKAGALALTLDAGAGNDSVIWALGAGSAVIDGGTGSDKLNLIGGTGDDTFQVFDNAGKLSVTASDGSVLDVGGMEQVRIDVKGGADTVVLGDLSATGVDTVTVDLGAGKSGGDGRLDTVTINPSLGEVMVITSAGGHTTIVNENTFQTVTIDHADATDVLNIARPLGNAPGEVIEASGLAMALHFAGGNGADTIFSGSGDDVIDGNQGNDVALMGAGNDRFVWDPGDGSDTVDGQAGFDTLQFNGSNIGEQIEILADGKHAELTRNVGAIDMHLDNVERIEFNAIGGADNIHVHDLSGTAVKQVAIDLAGFGGTGDGANDTVTIDGTGGNDHMTVSSTADGISITGLAAQVTVAHGEPTDALVINGGDGNDTIDASGVLAGNGHLTLDGGAGNDSLTGSQDSDLIFGGDGHDILNGGAGSDTLDGGQGDDIITGGLGDDVMGGGDGADTFNYNGLLDGHDLIEGFTTGQDHLDLTKFFDSLGVDPADRADRVSITDRGDGSFDVAVDADGNKGNGAEHAVAVVFSSGPLTVGTDVVVHH